MNGPDYIPDINFSEEVNRQLGRLTAQIYSGPSFLQKEPANLVFYDQVVSQYRFCWVGSRFHLNHFYEPQWYSKCLTKDRYDKIVS